jgi:hypothetical protein
LGNLDRAMELLRDGREDLACERAMQEIAAGVVALGVAAGDAHYIRGGSR